MSLGRKPLEVNRLEMKRPEVKAPDTIKFIQHVLSANKRMQSISETLMLVWICWQVIM